LSLLNDSLSELRQTADSIKRQLENQHVFDVNRFLDFELLTHPRYSDPKRLTRYAAQVCSQNGEDGIIREIFKRIGATDRTFVEIGVGDGNENNTAFLVSQGWRGVWIDGNRDFLRTLEIRGWLGAEVVKGRQAFVTRENVVAILNEFRVPREFDLLSLDIDQNTYYVWEALATFRPRVVVVEYNSAVPPDVEWAVDYSATSVWDGTQNFGAGLKSFELLGERFGYDLVGCDFYGVNAFFVRKDLSDGKFAAPFTAENHYEPPRYSAYCRRSHPVRALDRFQPARSVPQPIEAEAGTKQNRTAAKE
jgi:hypothetical protein